MKTVPTLCATSTGIGISALGFALVRPVHEQPHPHPHPPPHPRLQHRPTPDTLFPPVSHSVDPGGSRPLSTIAASSLAPPSDMTSTATCTVQTVDTYATPTSFCSPFGFSARHSLRSASSQSIATSRDSTDNARATLKKREGQNMPRGAATPAQNSGEALHSQHSSWMKRLSFSSRDSTRCSTSRPDSTVTSVSPSASESTTPMISSQVPSAMSAPNKLVKRSTSLSRGTAPTQQGDANSKLPLPVLKRPATSHKRSATLQERRSTAMPKAEDAFRHSFHAPSPESLNDAQWLHFFTPRLPAPPPPSRRRGSTSIPNPIKRIYPDRKYRPVLVSASEPINAATPEFDIDEAEIPEHVITPQSLPEVRYAGDYQSAHRRERPATISGPPPSSRSNVSSTTFDASIKAVTTTVDDINEEGDDENSQDDTSSFSASDMSSADAQMEKELPPPKPPIVKYRRPGTRNSSSTPSSMGNRQSLPKDEDEPLVKRCDVTTLPQASASPSIANPLAKTDSTPSPPSVQPPSTQSTIASRNGSIRRSLADSNAFSSPNSSSTLRPSHPSISSDFTSLLAGPDSDVRSGDDDTSDSDLIFDSVRTRAPKSSPGRRGPPIESIFGDSPPIHSHVKYTMLRDFLQQAPLHDQGNSLKPRQYSTIHEEDSLSTPARPGDRQQSLTSSPALYTNSSPMPASMPSSPPSMPSLSDLRQHANRFPSTDDEDVESSWSFSGDDESENQQPVKNRFAHLGITSEMLSPFTNQGSSSAATTPRRRESRQTDLETRSSIFDWSEQQPLDKSPNNRSPPRPKTVHGKKDAETRGSRSVGRRAPSGLHTRSQSVPAKDAEGKRGQTASNKFGTWGIGSKGATEDWNEDFDFEEPAEEKRLDSGISMFVPEKIRKQQTEVLANISLLRDWGLLIEELKELKVRAAGLNVLDGDNKKTWGEVDAMIELADQESDEQTLAPRFSPPSSPSFDYGAFDEPLSPTSTKPTIVAPTFDFPDLLSDAESGFSDYEDAIASPSRVENGIFITPATPRRPRKNSEAVARSVIERLQQKTNLTDLDPASGSRLDKVHFDTATLKRIIPHVQELRDKAKKVIRDAEDLLPSPKSFGSINSNGSRSVRRKQREVQESPSTLRRKTRRSAHLVDRTPSDDSCHSPTDELSARLQRLMAVN